MNYIITNELVEGLKDLLNERLVSIILYGSVAKGTDTDESDIDIAIIVKDAKSQSKMITIASNERKYKRAKDIGERFPDYAVIQYQMITIAII